MLLVDAANVVGARAGGWWRDRPGAAHRLVDELRAAVADGRVEPPVVVVLEGRARDGAPETTDGGLHVVHAPGNGDDTLAALARRAGAAGAAVTLVSADRALRSRAADAGASSLGPRWLLERLA